MSELVGHSPGVPETPAGPQPLRSITDGEFTALGTPVAPGTALTVRAPPAPIPRHNAGWLVVHELGGRSTRAMTAGVLLLLSGMRGLYRSARWLVATTGGAVKSIGDWVFGVAKIAIVGLAGFIVFQAIKEPALVIDPIVVTLELAAQGTDGKQLAARIIEDLTSYDYLVHQVWSDKESRALDKPAQLPELQVPGAQVSLRQIVDAIRTVVSRERRLSGQLLLVTHGAEPICGDGSPARTMQLRLRSDYDTFAYQQARQFCAGPGATQDAIAKLMEDASMAVLRATNPCGAAAYYYALWKNQTIPSGQRFQVAHRMVDVCMARPGGDDKAFAHQLRGLLFKLQANNMPPSPGGDREVVDDLLRDSLEQYDLAEVEFEGSLLNRTWAFLGFSNFLPTLQVHRGDALLDTQKPAEAEAEYKKASVTNHQQVYAWLGQIKILQAELDGTPADRFDLRADLVLASLCAVASGLDKRPDAGDLYYQKALALAAYLRLQWPADRGPSGDGVMRLPRGEKAARYCKEGDDSRVVMTRAKAREDARKVLLMARDVDARNPRYALAWARMVGARAIEGNGRYTLDDAMRAIRRAREYADERHEDPFYALDGEAMLQIVAGDLEAARRIWEAAVSLYKARGEPRQNNMWREDALASSAYFAARVDVLGDQFAAATAKLVEARRRNPKFDEAKSLLECVSGARLQAAPGTTLLAAAGDDRPPGQPELQRMQCRIGLPGG